MGKPSWEYTYGPIHPKTLPEDPPQPLRWHVNLPGGMNDKNSHRGTWLWNFCFAHQKKQQMLHVITLDVTCYQAHIVLHSSFHPLLDSNIWPLNATRLAHDWNTMFSCHNGTASQICKPGLYIPLCNDLNITCPILFRHE